MKSWFPIIATAIFTVVCHTAVASQADDTTITITGQTAGATPFISQLTLTASDTSVIKSIQFTITPKPGSVTRPLSGTYSRDYLVSRGYLQPPTGEIFLPVHGLYDDFTNTVTLTYYFLDGSSNQDSATITTTVFDDGTCDYKSPTLLQPRTESTGLSYDYMMVKGACGTFSPVILDSDGALRWVSPLGSSNAFIAASTFFDSAAYVTQGSALFRVDLDGTVSMLADYSNIGVVNFHHNIDYGKVGIILEADTEAYFETVVIEVDGSGSLVKTWNPADIISAAMIAGGDDPGQFVYPAPTDWFHNNAVTYNRADNSLIISSRENFLICIDYETSAIKWILGDTTKKWFQFPSLAQYALALAPGSLPPIGQHAVSITYDQNVLLFDNGLNSLFQDPPGVLRSYASPRKYQLDLETKVATEVWNYEMDQSISSSICGSVYEDAPLNYFIDYSFVGGSLGIGDAFAQLLGLDAAGEKVFYYQYPTIFCNTAFNSIPIHLENTRFPTFGPQALNLSTRGTVSPGDNVLIGGFIVTGTDTKKVALRVLGPSLDDSGLSVTLADPVLTLYDSSGVVIATNDDWGSDPGASEILANGLAPGSPAESATVQTLAPAAYTVVATGKDSTSGIGLVEAYDLSPESDSRLANISTRGAVETGDNVLISGFIIGDAANATVVIRALGPSLTSSGVSGALSDPTLTIYDVNGSAIASNDNWQDDISVLDIEQNDLAPQNDAEAATILNLAAGAYSAIMRGADGGTGVGLIEVYDLD